VIEKNPKINDDMKIISNIPISPFITYFYIEIILFIV